MPERSSPWQLTVAGVIGRASRDLAAARLRDVLDRFAVRPTAGRVGFVDENGPKGGVDIRCRITLEVPRLSAIHAEAVAETPRLAFDRALEALGRTLGRERERRREARRRPRKYYVARRLLQPDVSLDDLGAGPAAERRSA